MTGKRFCAVAGGVLVLIFFFAWARGLSRKTLEHEVATHYPAQAAAFVEQNGCRGPLYNHFNWGGYLLWRLPGLPVSMDGRTVIHGDERLKRSAHTWAGFPDWDSDPELAAAGVVIAEVNMPLTQLLRLDHHFRKVYEDSVSVVFVPDVSPPVASALDQPLGMLDGAIERFQTRQ